jgi:hypothetical protein
MEVRHNTSLIIFFGHLLAVAMIIVMTCHAQAQVEEGRPPDTINKARLIGVGATAGALYATTVTGLYFLWYADYPQSSFHWIDDSGEWYGIDKCGHITSSYWMGKIGYESLRWAGVPEKKSIWYGGTWGFVYLLSVEIFDGFSAEWGASATDLAANTVGAGLFIGQQLAFKKQPVTLKVSFHPTEYAEYRPDLLGENFIQQMLKDYNGQTYWLSANISSFLPESSKFPRWLSVSFGYGADGMLGAGSNPEEYNGEPLPEFDRYPQFYFSLDADLTRIRTKSETLHWLLNLIGYIKIPFPTLEYNPNDGLKFHPIYF